jgi:hypothetical protein
MILNHWGWYLITEDDNMRQRWFIRRFSSKLTDIHSAYWTIKNHFYSFSPFFLQIVSLVLNFEAKKEKIIS